MKILAIDDSPTLRKFIFKHLTAYSDSYEVLLASTGEEGVNSALKNIPDLILLDFILPDFNGDEVCRRLLDDEKTSSIPVILMSSSAPDIEKNEGEFDNIVRSMIKPFSPQLLCASASSVLKKAKVATTTPDAPASFPAETKETKPATTPVEISAPASATPPKKETILFCGKASYFPMYHALLGIEAEKANGVLYLNIESGQREVYFREGKPLLATTRNPELYLSCGKLDIPEESQEYFETIKAKQGETGNPVFFQMAADQYLSAEYAQTYTNQFGNVLVSEIWVSPDSSFKFITENSLPDFVPTAPIKETMLDWIAATLRSVNTSNPLVANVAKPDDVLSFTAEGYKKIQSMSLTAKEVGVITQLGEGNSAVGQIAQATGLQWHDMSRILFLMKQTRLIDIWPSA